MWNQVSSFDCQWRLGSMGDITSLISTPQLPTDTRWWNADDVNSLRLGFNWGNHTDQSGPSLNWLRVSGFRIIVTFEADLDSDGIPNSIDPDRDGDLVANINDCAPDNQAVWQLAYPDSDRDNLPNSLTPVCIGALDGYTLNSSPLDPCPEYFSVANDDDNDQVANASDCAYCNPASWRLAYADADEDGLPDTLANPRCVGSIVPLMFTPNASPLDPCLGVPSDVGDGDRDGIPDANDCAPCDPRVLTPRIVIPPTSEFVCIGRTATFSVGATTPDPQYPLQYQWYHNGSPLDNGVNPCGSRIFGAQSSELRIVRTCLEDRGVYRCDVSSICGNAPPHQPVQLTVPTCCADYNQDGVADNSDIFDLADDIASGQQSFPPSSPDFNNDGVADISDILDLAGVVAGANCP